MRTIATILATSLAVLISTTSARAADLRYFEDATLRSVQFVDAGEGWAVGDEGVIWHTIDGGKTWERQESGVRASLRSVHFVLPFKGTGWIAGREELPRGGSIGVLLYTQDAGVAWKRILINTMPGLNQVRFTDPSTGFLIGDGCDQFASGVFQTKNGGQQWEPVKGPRISSWLAGDFQDAGTAILAGAWSRLATLRQDVFSLAQVDALDGRSILGMQVLPQRALAVGQGGLILSSSSGGAKWGFVDTKLPREVLQNLDFHAIHAVGPKVWIAGRPGSVILSSDDQGQNWRLNKMGQNFPLNSIHFFDAQRGWAVGEAGTILTSSDGGQSWKVQRQGGKRAAVLFVHAQSAQFAPDTLARLGAEEGNLLTALQCAAPMGSSEWNHALASQRFAAGTRLAGGMTGETLWQFRLPQILERCDKQAILEHWNRLHGGDAELQLVRQLVLALRMWRPTVIVGDSPQPEVSGSPAAALIAQALKVACAQAGDPQAFPEQIEQLGLLPWRVSRCFAGWDKKNSQIIYDTNEISVPLEGTYREYAAGASRILTDGISPLPLERSYRLVARAADDKANPERHLLDGLTMPVGEARRQIPQESFKNADAIKTKIRNRRNLILLAEKLKDPGSTLAQIGPMLDGLPEEQGAAAAFAVAGSFVRQGQWHLAREAFLLMVEKYPTQPLTAEAYRWLIQHAGSSEARRRHELGQFFLLNNVAFSPKNPLSAKNSEEGIPKAISQASLTYLGNKSEALHWYRGSLDLGKRLSAYGLMYATDPAMQFCMQASRRQLGELDQAKDWYGKIVANYPRGPWHDAATTELWMLGGGGDPGKRLGVCRLTQQKPYLDGVFDDPCWKGLAPLLLENAVGDTAKQCRTEAWLAYDQEYLYIALRCQHPAAMQVPPEKNRSRDAQLDPYDRVSILLDLDRDYSTYFHLQIDQRGCVREDCWGDLSWNPKWHVAVKSTPEAWCIEAAIPLIELTGERVTENSAWACNVVRILPGRGVQAWSLPADVQPRPEGMGVLMFRDNK